MSRNRDEDYDWLDDPFNDKKKPVKDGMGGGAKAVVGLGCVAVVIIIIVLLVMVLSGVSTLASSM